MHYAKDAFATIRGLITMMPIDQSFEVLNFLETLFLIIFVLQNIIGKVKNASPSDYTKICNIYNCSQCMKKPFTRTKLTISNDSTTKRHRIVKKRRGNKNRDGSSTSGFGIISIIKNLLEFGSSSTTSFLTTITRGGVNKKAENEKEISTTTTTTTQVPEVDTEDSDVEDENLDYSKEEEEEEEPESHFWNFKFDDVNETDNLEVIIVPITQDDSLERIVNALGNRDSLTNENVNSVSVDNSKLSDSSDQNSSKLLNSSSTFSSLSTSFEDRNSSMEISQRIHPKQLSRSRKDREEAWNFVLKLIF